MPPMLNDTERKVLTAIAADDGAWFNHFEATVIDAAGSIDAAQATCQALRRRKLVDGQGRGQWAQYGINEAGKAALA